TAFDGANHAFVDRLQLVVDYVSITSPVPPRVPSVAAMLKPGTVVPVTGTATGASFQSYRVEWARGVNPASGWSAAGMTLPNGGPPPGAAALPAPRGTSGTPAPRPFTGRPAGAGGRGPK